MWPPGVILNLPEPSDLPLPINDIVPELHPLPKRPSNTGRLSSVVHSGTLISGTVLFALLPQLALAEQGSGASLLIIVSFECGDARDPKQSGW
mmetsp:Transcript_135381/g.342547  ORF Transcript_135381/g.342547 Transcript_135381/m.342547 type:complete len:93 (-) Transcript_135381:27-305(-)